MDAFLEDALGIEGNVQLGGHVTEFVFDLDLLTVLAVVPTSRDADATPLDSSRTPAVAYHSRLSSAMPSASSANQSWRRSPPPIHV